MDETKAFKHITRIGFVSSVDTSKKTARVKFEDKNNMISSQLKIIDRGDDWTPTIGQLVICIYLPNSGGDGFVIGGI